MVQTHISSHQVQSGFCSCSPTAHGCSFFKIPTGKRSTATWENTLALRSMNYEVTVIILSFKTLDIKGKHRTLYLKVKKLNKILKKQLFIVLSQLEVRIHVKSEFGGKQV